MKYQHEYTEQIVNGKLEDICLDLLQCVYPCDWSDLRQEAINNGVPEEILNDIDQHGLSVRLYAPGMTDRASGFKYTDWEVSSVDGFFFDLPRETKQVLSDWQDENDPLFLHLVAFAIEACVRMTAEVKSLSWFNEVNESIEEANIILEEKEGRE